MQQLSVTCILSMNQLHPAAFVWEAGRCGAVVRAIALLSAGQSLILAHMQHWKKSLLLQLGEKSFHQASNVSCFPEVLVLMLLVIPGANPCGASSPTVPMFVSSLSHLLVELVSNDTAAFSCRFLCRLSLNLVSTWSVTRPCSLQNQHTVQSSSVHGFCANL